MNAKNLTELRDYLQSLRGTDGQQSVNLCELPVFGGVEPSDTHGIYSWDETHVLVLIQGTWTIERRVEAVEA